MSAHQSHGSHRAPSAGGHQPGFAVERRPRAILLAVLALVGVATLSSLLALWPDGDEVDAVTSAAPFALPGVSFPVAEIDVVHPPCPEGDTGEQACGRIDATVVEGDGQGDEVSIPVSPQVSESGLEPGDRVKLQRTPAADGGDPVYSYFGTVRSGPLLLLTLLFVVLVLVVARWRGLFALFGLAFSAVVIWTFLIPALLTGADGLAVGLCASAAIMFVVLYTTHGFSIRTSAALAGTLAGVLVTAGLGVLATSATNLTGVGDDTAGILSSLVGDLSFHGLFACAIVVAGLGVLNDVTITQASSVWEIRGAAPTLSRRQVFTSGMRIGRDHIASTIYTIVFAYAGTALALLLVLQVYGLPIADLLTTEEIAQEIVRTLASSIGLVLAVPLTTGIAATLIPGALEE